MQGNKNAEKASDAVLKDTLSREEFSRSTNAMDTSTGEVRRCLLYSKTRIAFSKDVPLRRSQLCRGLARCKLNSMAAKSDNGRCDYCRSFVHHKAAQIVSTYLEGERSLNGSWKQFLDRFRELVEAHALNSAILPRGQSLQYHDELSEFLEPDHDEYINHLPDETKHTLQAAIYIFIQHLQPLRPDLTAYSHHLSLKRSVDELFFKDWNDPKPNCCYFLGHKMVASFSQQQ